MANVVETENGGIVIVFRDRGASAPATSTPRSLVQGDAPSLIGTAAPVANAPTAGQGFTLDAQGRIPTSAPATALSVTASDPANPVIGQVWYRSDNKLSVQTGSGVKSMGLEYIDYSSSFAWTSTGVAPALGNATVVARYVQLGKFLHYVGQVTFGGTSTFGTGAYDFSLPVDRAASVVARVNGVVDGIDTSTGARVIAVAETAVSTSKFRPVYAGTYLGAGANLGPSAPWTWASGDTIAWNLTYECA